MSSPARVPSYAFVLSIPGAARFLVPALLGRLSYGMVSLALVLSIVHATDSYADVGLLSALFGLGVTVLSPLRARLIDRYGALRALPPMALLHACALLGLAVATWEPGGGTATPAVLTAVAGACAPPLGPVTRTIWSRKIADRGVLQRAYSLDTVFEETIFFTGPLLLGVLMTVASAPVGLVLSAALVSVGTAGLVTSPAVRSPSMTDRGVEESSLARTRGSGLISRAGFFSAVALSAAVGLTMGATSLLNVAFAERWGAIETVVWVEAALSLGSALGGLAYGAVVWRTGTRTRSVLLCLASGVGVAAAASVSAVPALVALFFVVGSFTAPLITTTYLLADESVRAGHRTRAGNWINTGHNAGSSLGAALVGALLANFSPNVVFLLAGAVSVVTALAVLLLGAGGVRAATGSTPCAR